MASFRRANPLTTVDFVKQHWDRKIVRKRPQSCGSCKASKDPYSITRHTLTLLFLDRIERHSRCFSRSPDTAPSRACLPSLYARSKNVFNLSMTSPPLGICNICISVFSPIVSNGLQSSHLPVGAWQMCLWRHSPKAAQRQTGKQ